jgi:diguanylate cyclase (GGDEF)-like protein/PAS domain S-box-containing protein
MWTLGDLAFVVTEQNGFNTDLESLGWFTASWMTGVALVALATNQDDVVDVGQPTIPQEGAVGAGRLAFAMAPVAIPVAIAVWPQRIRSSSFSITLAVGSALLVAFTYLRALGLLRAREAARTELLARERYFRLLTAHSSDAVLVLDEGMVVRNESPSLARLLRLPDESISGRAATSLAEPVDRQRALQFFQLLLERPGEVREIEMEVDLPDGTRPWLGFRGVNLLDDPDVAGVIIHLHDVTDRKLAEQELQLRAFHDPLTGLANRALLLDRLEQALRRSSRSGRLPAVVFLDLDGFKAVNDSLGHDSGDRLLCLLADRLRNAVGEADTVARLGGDEFAILVEDRTHPLPEATTLADRVLRALAQPVELEGHDLTVSASIGVAVGSGDATAVSLVRDADIAMYRAKGAGKGHWVAYEPGMHTAAVERLQVETDLPRALDEGQFELRYQPVVDLVTGQVIAFEALLRWNHPTLGQIAPDRFIPVAEATGAIVPIGAWVLQEACRTAARWRRDHPTSDLHMGVNVSGRQLADPDLVGTVVDALVDNGWPAGDLVLEVTETSLVEDVHLAAERLHALAELGVGLAIDDFGTGYSSLTYLRLFPVDTLKVDRSFIDSITEQGRTPAIVRGLLDLGRTLGLQTLAEGIEHTYQLDLLREEGCDLGQGYLFARPLSAADAEDLVARSDQRLWPVPGRSEAVAR